MIDEARAIEILEQRMKEIEVIRKLRRFSPEFKRWRRDTEVAIERIFGGASRHLGDFCEVAYSVGISIGDSESTYELEFQTGLAEANSVLSSMVDEIKTYGISSKASQPDALTVVEAVCSRFHLIARQLRERHSDRTTLAIDDEYDVQDLLHALLYLHFDDVRAEEWTPSYAGGASRMDFLLKNEQLVIEVKKSRKGMSSADLGSQLIVDMTRYAVHPDCKCLVCFVYDPEGRLGNPAGIENDLSKISDGLQVKAIVVPKGA